MKKEEIQAKINKLEWRAYAISPTSQDLWEIQKELFERIEQLKKLL